MIQKECSSEGEKERVGGGGESLESFRVMWGINKAEREAQKIWERKIETKGREREIKEYRKKYQSISSAGRGSPHQSECLQRYTT
jgi:hypothetical protein